MIITVNEIDKILNNALTAYKSGSIQYKNIVFIGNAGIGRSSRIDNWINKHLDEIAPHYLTPAVLMKEKNGILIKDTKNGKAQYGFADSNINGLLADGAVCICKNLNTYVTEQIEPFNTIFSKRTYCIPITNKEYDLHKLFLAIATVYPDNFGYRITDISDILTCSDVYTVIPSTTEFKEYFDNKTSSYIDEKDKIEAFDKILSSPYFNFILEKDEKFSPCTFMSLFDFCETGNKGEILSNIRSDNRIGAKTLEMFQKIFDEEETK